MSQINVRDKAIFVQTVQRAEAIQDDIRTTILGYLQKCYALVEETEIEKNVSYGMLETARIEEEIAKNAWLASIGTYAEPAARAAYDAAIQHRKNMESRYELACQCVTEARFRADETEQQLRANKSWFDKTLERNVIRMRKIDRTLDEYLSTRIESLFGDVEDDEPEDTDKRVPMNPGKDDEVVFVFSCPGQEEEKSGRVCTGKTGEHLDYLVGLLNDDRPDVFKYRDRYSYRITNASDRVYYQATTGSTEASDKDIKEPLNIARISDEVKNAKYILCMGRKAQTAVELACPKGKIIISDHLSLSNLNRNSKYRDMGSPSEKIKFIAQQILSQV